MIICESLYCCDNLVQFEVPEIIFGEGALGKIGECAKRLGGERVLLVTDPGIIEAGWIDESINYLEQEDIPVMAEMAVNDVDESLFLSL